MEDVDEQLAFEDGYVLASMPVLRLQLGCGDSGIVFR